MDYVSADIMDPNELGQYLGPVQKPKAPAKPRAPPKGKGKKMIEPPKKTIEKKRTDYPKKGDRPNKSLEDFAKEAWKLFRSRYTLIFHICSDCNSNLYKDQDKYE